jgi:hypothetical protein
MVGSSGNKVDRAHKEMVYTVVVSAVQNMITQIVSIPKPIHPSYKQFVKRLVKFLQNEKKIMMLGNKIVKNERFMELIGQEGFNDETGNEINVMIQNTLLESFSDEATNEVKKMASSSSQYGLIEQMDSYTKDPLMVLVMYVVLGFAAYTIYKNMNKSA